MPVFKWDDLVTSMKINAQSSAPYDEALIVISGKSICHAMRVPIATMGDLVVRMYYLRRNRESNDCRTRCLRYCLRMKKPNLMKLPVRRETLRALTGIELTRVAGGDDTFSGAAVCPLSGALGTATCPAPAATTTPRG